MATTLELVTKKIQDEAEQKLQVKIDQVLPLNISGVNPDTLINFTRLNTQGSSYALKDVMGVIRALVFEQLKTSAFQTELASFLDKAEKVK